ncbi:MAG: DUF1631 domain-containing protein [Polaromonas sp.]|uniref:DUF1631 family protein n=1 Tax=Polaromonas sp. TaxID=1869339 RepID=UPI00180299B4|nr:DUF1631 family protein [Polaromonas sp.]MBA3593387.1 DUF1631 domain-containing protein [Polaromonas sp.]
MAANNKQDLRLARQAREQFVACAAEVMPALASEIKARLSAAMDEAGNAREMQDRRDGWISFQENEIIWINATTDAWKKALAAPEATYSMPLDSGKFELMGNEVMENKILASRLALRLLDSASWELNDLRLRIQGLEGVSELPKEDILRPEVLSQNLVEQWTLAPLSRELWLTVQDLIQQRLTAHLLEAYRAANEFLIKENVMVDIDRRALVKRTPSAALNPPATMPPRPTGLSAGERASLLEASPGGRPGDGGSSGSGGSGRNGGGSEDTGWDTANDFVSDSSGPDAEPAGRYGASSGVGGSDGTSGSRGTASGGASGGGGTGGPGRSARAGGGSGRGGRSGGARAGSETVATRLDIQDETRMQTGTSPLARARMRAQGVMGHLKRLLSDHAVEFDQTQSHQPSPQLAQALARVPSGGSGGEGGASYEGTMVDAPDQIYGAVQVEEVAGALRQRTAALKQAATTSSEKATIEIVALMFQSILAEDRIPPAMRVWFARLQMPVLRVAISEPEFFGSLQHPARRLIDRMGSCVLGFDATVSGGALEIEVKRVVQVIEQYPETGRRVFQLVYDEFQKFLSKFLSEQGSAARVVTLAQQLEQKETMAIQYTIEMRSMLNDMPVREEIREFLFKTWAEVLAIAAMKNGPQHKDTITLKQAAADLVWAASAKPNRNDRARVIADLPKLLQLLRMGMAMLGMATPVQDQHLKTISDTLADAFMSKTDAISVERIDEMAKRLANLEDYLSDEDVGDLPLDTENLVMMIGIDASDLAVIADGGSRPSEAMRAWAQELQLGAWFSLDHNGQLSHVQFAWRSDRKQLHLFATTDGRNFLIQARRLAAYLQAGLLVPTEDEALTVRATRDALAKLDANPERLLG